MKKIRNSKRIGVKSIHYNNNNIYIQDSFSKDVKLLYDVEYFNVSKLKSAKSVTKVDDLKNIANFEDLKDKKGFELSKKISNNDELKSKITSVKSKSYLQTVKHINTENNFEVQIYKLYEDVKKTLALYCNNVVYKIDSLMQQKLGANFINSRNFDFLGTIISERDYDKSKVKFDGNPNNGPGSFDTRIKRLVEVFRDLKILEKKQNNNSITEQDKRNAYNYIALLALIRNYSLHKDGIEIKYHLKKVLDDIVKHELCDYKKDFVKTNKKYLYILKDVYNNEKIFQDFFNYITFDKKNNLGLSVEKITKNIMNEMKLNSYVDSERYFSEFRKKFKILLSFDVYNWFKGNILTCVKELKECENENQKKVLYKTYSRRYQSDTNSSIKNIISGIKKYLGEKNTKELDIKIDFEVDEYIKNDFINCIYVFSIFLNKKDANSMYSDLIDKINNIKELIILAKKTGVNVSETIIASHNSVIPLSSDFKNIINQLGLLKNLRLIRMIDINKKRKDNFGKEPLKQIYDCFIPCEYSIEDFFNDINKDENRKEIKNKKSKNKKPLKNILRKNVLDSRNFQVLSSYTKTSICRKIMRNENLVKFALYDALGIVENVGENEKLIVDDSSEELYKFISQAYYDYKKINAKKNDDTYLLSINNVNELAKALSKYTVKNLVDSVFNQSCKFDYKAILKLYFMVCYLVVRGVIRMNSSYFIAIQDYENIYKSINKSNNDKVKFDFSVIDHYKNNAPNKKSRSYKQLITLLEKPYIKVMRNKDKRKQCKALLKLYRNTVAHCTLLCDDKIWDVEFKNIKSYFGIYQTLMQSNTSIRKKCEEVWGDLDEYFKLDDDKSYSTKLTIAMNIIFAYNMSRFNNNTIEKYAMKKND